MGKLSRKTGLLGAGLAVLILGAVIAGQALIHTEERSLFPSLAKSEFSLLSHEGTAITNADLVGRPTAIYFGFTWCPDICPTTLSQLADAKASLIADNVPQAEQLQIVFFTVDPERDTVHQLSEYLTLFDADITGITGPVADIMAAVSRFGVFAQKVPASDEDYQVDHSASVYLYDRKGQFIGTISPAEPAEMGLAKLERLVTR